MNDLTEEEYDLLYSHKFDEQKSDNFDRLRSFLYSENLQSKSKNASKNKEFNTKRNLLYFKKTWSQPNSTSSSKKITPRNADNTSYSEPVTSSLLFEKNNSQEQTIENKHDNDQLGFEFYV